MANETCTRKKKASKEMLKALHDSQAGEGRHKCAVCAYDTGLRNGLALAIKILKKARRVT